MAPPSFAERFRHVSASGAEAWEGAAVQRPATWLRAASGESLVDVDSLAVPDGACELRDVEAVVTGLAPLGLATCHRQMSNLGIGAVALFPTPLFSKGAVEAAISRMERLRGTPGGSPPLTATV